MATSKKNSPKRAKRNVRKTSKKSAIKKSLSLVPSTLRDATIQQNTTLDTLYVVNDSTGNITLEVNAGAEGQTSDMTIKLDDKIIAQNLAGDFPETVIGTNKKLNGQKLTIVATIADTSQETNLTSLTIHLKGGVGHADFPLSKTVDDEGASVDYLCLIEFFDPNNQ